MSTISSRILGLYLDIPYFNTLVPGTSVQYPPIHSNSTHRPFMSLIRMTYILGLIVSLFYLEGTSRLTRRARPPLSPVKSRGRPDFADSGSRMKVMILEDRTSGSPFLLHAFRPRSFCFSRAVELWKKCPGSLETLMTFEDQRRSEFGRLKPRSP